MFELKPISREGIPEALEKVERYRLLNEPSQAESICLDVLRIDPENQRATVMLLLALTDQFGNGIPVNRAREVLPGVRNEYERCYYSGIVCERWAQAQIRQGSPGSGFNAYESFEDAMRWYEKAEGIRPAGNDDAILRWNTCARILMRNPDLRPRPAESMEPVLDD
jgi:hypothetical protein